MPAIAPVHALAPVYAPAARRLAIARTLDDAGGMPATGVAVTFDDGPHPEGTPAILEVLAAHRAVATFFVIGEQVQRHPELLHRILAGGHAIALHGYRHRLQLRLPDRAVLDDLRKGVAAIEDAAGVAPILHRPPYGIYSPGGLRAARDLGLKPLLWASWGKDWRRLTTPGRIAGRVLRELAAGDVILLHDADYYSSRNSHERTARALPIILSELIAREIGTVLAV
jgi:peptidoglycan/xylan/chitin deacetylase (PgdA/CDA1 family)